MEKSFGEFSSAEEINRAAAAQLREGDTDAIIAIAKENGIDEEDAQDYIDGMAPELCTPIMAALGKLKIEEEELKPYGIMKDWITYIRIRCAEDGGVAAGVMKKGHTLKGCIAALLVWSWKNAREVDPDIKKQAGVPGRCSLGIPDMGTARKLITEYYLGGKS